MNLNYYRFEDVNLFSKHYRVNISEEEIKARNLSIELCNVEHAVKLNKVWHSRLPNVQKSPWQFAFKAHIKGYTFAVALWHNPSARLLPNNWLELRRMACSNDAPKNTGSLFLNHMVRYFRAEYPDREKCISYQDVEWHDGTIYKAAGWKDAYYSKGRKRKRNYTKPGTNRKYRKDMNGKSAACSSKIRWEINL